MRLVGNYHILKINFKGVKELLITMIKKKMLERGRDDFVNYLSEILGISKAWASNKLSGKVPFTAVEISTLNREFDFDANELKESLGS